jgi:hypothetical protein
MPPDQHSNRAMRALVPDAAVRRLFRIGNGDATALCGEPEFVVDVVPALLWP